MKIETGMKIVATKTNYPSGVPNGTIMTVTSDDGDRHVHATVDGGDGFPWFMHYGTYEIFSISDVDPVDMTPAADMPVLWRDMTPAEKGAMLLSDHDGKAMQAFLFGGQWEDKKNGFPYFDSRAYRVKPEPTVETVTLYTGYDGNMKNWTYFQDAEDTHRITFNLIDGKPDCASIRMEEL